MARDDFPPKTIETLKARVAHRCSNPDCRVPTSAPSDKNKVTSIGIAAHICAASPGGPRFNSSMTPVERKSINNAIWLCSNCSIDIDRDIVRYSVEILNEWKEKAEYAARSELGKKLPSGSETIDTVAAALTGFPKDYLANAISNVHQASQKSLEKLDPRFHVKTTYTEGMTSIGIYAKENVEGSMIISGNNIEQYLQKYKFLLEHGTDLELESDSITMEGSALLKELFEKGNGVLKISKPKLAATQKLWLVERHTSLLESFDDIQGAISFGAKTFSFKGNACQDLFNLTYQKSFDENDDKANITISLSLHQWEGISLTSLPFFEKLHSLFERMSNGWEMFTSLEIAGTRVFVSKGSCLDRWEYVADTASLLHYVSCCRTVTRYFGMDIPFSPEISYTSDDHRKISEAADIVEGRKFFDAHLLSSNPTCKLIVDDDCAILDVLQRMVQPSTIQIDDPTLEEVTVFGERLTLPSRVITLENVLPRVQSPILALKKGDAVSVEWVPQDNFQCSIRYKS